MMYNSWSNVMKALLITVAICFNQFALAELRLSSDEDIQDIDDDKRPLKRLQNGYEVDQQLHNYNYDSDDYADAFRNLQNSNNIYNNNGDDKTVFDKRGWKMFNDRETGKRGPSNWNNLRQLGWGKREQQGNWNNLRGLWGKRSAPSSSWGRLQGSWGRK